MQTHNIFRVKKAGLKTSFQDNGRYGYQDMGVPVSGAMDIDALHIGNVLVGNDRETVGMEVALLGPVLDVLDEVIIAITGAHLSPHVNGESVNMWQSLRLQKGDRLTFGEPVEGVYAYISVAGGFSAANVMGSRSTYDRVPLGDQISKNDVIQSYVSDVSSYGWGVLSAYRPHYQDNVTVRTIRGLHEDYFTKASITTFYERKHQISSQSNRVGYRLQPVNIWHKKNRKPLTSMAAPLGGIQVPADGCPIVLMRDHQTTGGYPLIATVIAADLYKLAQLTPGSHVYFTSISVAEAQTIYQQNMQALRALQYMLPHHS